MSLSTLVQLIRPKTGVLPLWNMKATGQQRWPGENCSQVCMDGEGGRGSFSLADARVHLAVQKSPTMHTRKTNAAWFLILVANDSL